MKAPAMTPGMHFQMAAFEMLKGLTCDRVLLLVVVARQAPDEARVRLAVVLLLEPLPVVVDGRAGPGGRVLVVVPVVAVHALIPSAERAKE